MTHFLPQSEKEDIIVTYYIKFLNKIFLIVVLRKLKLVVFTGGPLNNPPSVTFQ